MPIIYDKTRKVFALNTPETTYGIAILDGIYVAHAYYGKTIPTEDIRCLLKENEVPYTPSQNGREKAAFLDAMWMEYPESGMGDFRESAFCLRTQKGHKASELFYESFEIEQGKPELDGMPSTWGKKEDCKIGRAHV